MKPWHNRELASTTRKQTNLAKRQQRFATLNPLCTICQQGISFDDFCKGRKTLCRSSECRSEVNRRNSLKQDKASISGAVKSSQKWILAQREALLGRQSKIEQCYSRLLKSLFSDVQEQVHFALPNGSNKFVDFVVDGVLIEIDGPHHTDGRNEELDAFCQQQELQLIRVDVTRHWMELFSEVGDIVKRIKQQG